MSLTRHLSSIYTHVQDTPSDVWTIVHSLAMYPIVDCYVTVNGIVQKIMPAAITFVDFNTVSVTFSTPFAGHATVA